MRAAVLATTMFCGMATGARADIATYATDFSVTAQALALGNDPVQNLTAFDPTLGTLTAASVELLGSFSLSPYFLLSSGGPLPTTASITPHLNTFPLSLGTITYATQANLPVVNGSIVGLRSFSFDVTGTLPLSYAADPILNLQPYTTISNANGNYDQADTGDADPSTINGIARVSYTYEPLLLLPPYPNPRPPRWSAWALQRSAQRGAGSVLVGLHDPGPALTPAQAAALHNQPDGVSVAWCAIPTPDGAGVIARAHTEAHDGGRLLPGHLAAGSLDELHTMMPPGLTFDPVCVVGSPPGCLGWWWN